MQASVQNIMLKRWAYTRERTILRSSVEFYARAYDSTLERTILRSSVQFYARAYNSTLARRILRSRE